MKVFMMNDCDWWMAETAEDATRDYVAAGCSSGDEDEPEELDDDQLDHLVFVWEADDGTNGRRSFREELNRRVAEGWKSEFFASTEC